MSGKSAESAIRSASIKKNVALNTFYEILAIILPFITAPYVSRVLGAKGVGIYSYTTACQSWFSMLAALGTVSYGTREIARARHNPEERSRLFWEIELLTVATTALCTAAWLIFILLNGEDRPYYIVLTLGVLNSAFDIHWFFSGLEQFQYQVRLNTIFRLLSFVLLFVLIRDEGDLLLYIALITVSNTLATASMWIHLPRFLVRVPRKDLHVFRHLGQVMVYFIPTIATSIYTVLDKTLLQILTHDAYQNGYYEQATKIINLVKALTFTSVNTVLGARISWLFKENRIDEIRRRIEESIHYILFMAIGCCLGIIGIAGRFIPVFFGPGYEGSILLLQLLSPVVVIIGISNCLGTQYYTPAGLRKQSVRYILAGSGVNLCINLLLIPRFQGVGAVIGTLVAESTITVLYMKHCNGFLTVRQLFRAAWKKLVAGFTMLAFLIAMNAVARGTILPLLLSVAGGGLIYTAMLALLGDAFISEILVKKILKRIKKRA